MENDITAPSWWIVGADENQLVLRCPGCNDTLSFEWLSSAFISQLLDWIEEHRMEKHSQEG